MTIDERRAAELQTLLERARDTIAELTAALEDKPAGPWTYATSIETRGLPGSTPGREPEPDVAWHVSSSRFAHVDYCASAAVAVLKIAAEGGNTMVAVRLIRLGEPDPGKDPWPGQYPDISATAR